MRYIKKLKPDVVHLRILHTCGVDLGRLLKYLARHDIPTVITLHDFWYMTGKCPFYTKLNCDKWKQGCGHCPYHNTAGRKQLLDRSARMLRDKAKWFQAIPRLAVIGVSDWVTDEARQSILKDAKIIQRIYNWIDLDVFYPRDAARKREALGLQGKYVILGVASSWKLHDRKGLDTYLELAELMPQHYQIVLVGGAEENVRLPDNVMVLPKTNSTTELAELYSMADVYLNLSAEETFGKVSAEAVSCGTPVVAYDSTANKEIVPPGAGALVEKLDRNEILAALQMLEQKPKQAYTEICRAYAEKNFHKERNIEAYLSMYEELIR